MSKSTKKQPFAVFDIDGTISRNSLYHALVYELIERGVLPKSLRQAFDDKFDNWRNRSHPEAYNEYTMAMVTAYEPLMTQVRVSDFEEAAAHVADRLKKQAYVFTRELAKKLKKRGYFLIAISGSPKEIVGPFANHYGFDDFVARKFERQGEYYTGSADRTYTDKDVILNELIARHNLTSTGSVAVGDSRGDLSLLDNVEQPIAFNPEKELMEHATQQGWKVVVERKNVIYELEQHDGRYVLASPNT